jgi:arylsulfatase A-like enzyme
MIQNNEKKPLTIHSLILPDEPFTVSSDTCGNKSLTKGKSCNVTVRFQPSVEGPANALLTIPSNDPDEPAVEVHLAGEGFTPRVVILNIDGLRGDVIQNQALDSPEEYPGLDAIFGTQHRVYTKAWTVFPSVTLVGHASIFTGTYPAMHGIVGNEWFDRNFAEPELSDLINPYPCKQNEAFPGNDPDIDDGIVNYLCADVNDDLGLLTLFCVSNTQNWGFPLKEICTQGLANAHLQHETLYEALSEAASGTSAVNFSQYWRGATIRFDPTLSEQIFYLCGKKGPECPLHLRFLVCSWNPTACSSEPATNFGNYDKLGAEHLLSVIEDKTKELPSVLTFYFAGLDGFCHAVPGAYPCQLFYLREQVDPLLQSISRALDRRDHEWRKKTLIVLTSDHGQTDAKDPTKFDIRSIKKKVADVLASNYCLGDCDSNPNERDVVLATNGGMAHVYLRNRLTKEWRDQPRYFEDVELALKALLGDRELRQVLDAVLVKDALLAEGLYRRALGTFVDEGSVLVHLADTPGYKDPRKNELINKLYSSRSGDVLIVLKDGYYFDGSEGEFWGLNSNHGGLSDTDLNIPLVLAGPRIKPGTDRRAQVSNTQIAATIYQFLTGNPPPDEMEPPLALR